MRPISEGLRAAQRAPGVVWTVTGRNAPRAAGGGVLLQAEEGLQEIWNYVNRPYQVIGQASDLQSAIAGELVGGEFVHVVRSELAGKIGVRITDDFGASIEGLTDIATLAAPYAGLVSTPGVAVAGNSIRVVYGDGDEVRWVGSTDGGATWSASALLYDGTGNYVRYSNFGVWHTGYGWAVVYSAWTAGGEIRLRGAHDVGAGWVNWAVHSSTVDWEVAGVSGGWVYLHGWNSGWNSLAAGEIEMSAGVFVAWWAGDLAVIDRAGVRGEIVYSNVRVVEIGDERLMVAREAPSVTSGGLLNSYYDRWVLAGLRGAAGAETMEEPLIIDGDNSRAHNTENAYLTAGQDGDRVLLVGGEYFVELARVADYVGREDEADKAVEVLEYTYSQRLGEGGNARLHLGLGNLDVRAGDLLLLQRTATAVASGAVVSGSDVRALRLVEVWRTSRWLEVAAVDGPGEMAAHVLRRQKVLRAGDRLAADDVRALVGWSGVAADAVDFDFDDDLSSGFVARPGASAWTALHRYLYDKQALARPGRLEASTVAGSRTSVSVIAAESDPYAGAADVEFVEYGTTPSGIEHLQGPYRQRIGDERTAFVALGYDAAGGEAWDVQLSEDGVDGVRRRPVVHVDRSLTVGALAEVVEAMRRRGVMRDARVRLSCGAHGGLELYDLVAFGGESYRVVSIKETWQGGRLEQEVELG